MSKETGGPAAESHVLTKREQFAMAVMQGMMSDFEAVYQSCPTGVIPADYAVSVAVVMADTMIAALEKNDDRA